MHILMPMHCRKARASAAPNQNGSIFIMTLIITSGMLVIGIEISTLLISSIRTAREFDAALIARYASESALEQGLYQLRKEDERDTLRLKSGTVGKATWTYESVSPAGAVRFSPTIPTFARSLLVKDSTVQFSLYTQTDAGTAAIGGIDSLEMTWADSDDQCRAQNPQQIPGIETSIIQWEGGAIDWDNAKVLKNFQQKEAFLTDKIATLKFDELEEGLSGKPMAIRIKTYFCDLSNVRIRLPQKGNPALSVPIPNYFFLRPVGMFGTIQEDLQVILPKKDTISDIFDFTFFSEEKVTKTE